jgi:hypothetical protein
MGEASFVVGLWPGPGTHRLKGYAHAVLILAKTTNGERPTTFLSAGLRGDQRWVWFRQRDHFRCLHQSPVNSVGESSWECAR